MQLKRKIEGEWHHMPDGEYSLCGLAFDGENSDELDKEDCEAKSAREINCAACNTRINAVRELIKHK